jgi:LPS O-antigen subunit length determinant protein (WzzB/FepE family)
MKKNYSLSKNEINVPQMWKTIWNGKIKIASITVVFFVIIAAYSEYQPRKPSSVTSSLALNLSKAEKFYEFFPLFDFLRVGKFNEEKFNEELLNRFADEFRDMDEILTVFKENKTVKKNISNLSGFDKEQKLYNYAKRLEIEGAVDEQNGKPISGYVLKFYWQGSTEEVRDIYSQTIELTLKSVKNSIFKELDRRFEMRKNSIIDIDLERIQYLTEQSKIAKLLNIVDNKVDFNKTSEPNVIYNFNTKSNSMYYLRGYKAIDKEISFLKERKYLKIYEIERQLELLKKQDIELIDYNIFLLKNRSRKAHKTLAWPTVFLVSLIIGVLYVLVSSAFQSSKHTRKRKNK